MKKRVVFACDIGGSKLLCGLVDEDGNVIDAQKELLSVDTTPDILEQRLERLFALICQRNPAYQPIACGMTIPGLADANSGVWEYACFSGISDYPIAARMEKKLHLPIMIENDVNACAVAEKMYGCCRDCDDFLWVTVSNGVGGGLILNGSLYRGAFGGAGEIGHLIVEDDGDTCPCGHRGCLEAMVAGPAISRRYEVLTGRLESAARIAALARGQERNALEVIRKTGEYLGKGLGRAASLLNVGRFVLGGGVMQSFDLMKASICEGFQKEAFARPNVEVKILPTALHYEAGLLGAAAITFSQIT